MNMLTEQQIDSLIEELEADFATLAKSEAMQKDALLPEEEVVAQEQVREEPALEAPAEASEEELESAPQEEMLEEQVQEAPQEEQMQEEAMSDEDHAMQLADFYQGLDESELQLHYEALVAAMQSMWESQAQEAPQEQAQEEEMPLAASELGKEELDSQNGELPKLDADKELLKEEVAKSEKKVKEMEKALEDLAKSLEAKLLPQRKDITDISDVLAKSEVEVLEKSAKEVKEDAFRLAKSTTLTKSERDVLNDYFLDNRKVKPVLELINKKSKES